MSDCTEDVLSRCPLIDEFGNRAERDLLFSQALDSGKPRHCVVINYED